MRPKNYIAASMALEGEDVVTGASIVINNVVSGSDIAVVNELFCFVDGNGTLVYHSHGGLNDEFDVASYRKLVELIEKSPALSSALF
jgi:hypothetical protein